MCDGQSSSEWPEERFQIEGICHLLSVVGTRASLLPIEFTDDAHKINQRWSRLIISSNNAPITGLWQMEVKNCETFHRFKINLCDTSTVVSTTTTTTNQPTCLSVDWKWLIVLTSFFLSYIWWIIITCCLLNSLECFVKRNFISNLRSKTTKMKEKEGF